jgi:hypothetical protein
VQGKDLSEAELQRIIETYDLDRNSVFDEVLCMSMLSLVSVSLPPSTDFLGFVCMYILQAPSVCPHVLQVPFSGGGSL